MYKNLRDIIDRGFITHNRYEEYSYTLTVAFCSFVYEMVFSQLLTVIFGGAAIIYATTIGIYMFSLGVGSIVTTNMSNEEKNFQRLEIYMALSPIGLFYIVYLTTLGLPDTPAIILSYIPVVIVGFFSGMEIPLLTNLLEKKSKSGFRMGFLLNSVYNNTVGILFDTEEKKENSEFSEILGMDYVGGLLGAITYALFLYPVLGIVTTIMIIGMLNAIVALIFSITRSTGKIPLIISLTLILAFTGGIVMSDSINEEVTNTYISNQIEGEYTDKPVNTTIEETKNTKYQKIVLYNRTVGNKSDKCMRLDMALQMCQKWVNSYHKGLIEPPMSMYENTSNMEVLIIGGGDWIAINRLRKYNVSIDHVDIDREFYNYMKDNTVFSKYHEDAYKYEKLESYPTDIFTFFRDRESKKYDMVIMDVPGLRSHKALSLYSEELYRIIKNHLTERGKVVTWSYDPNWFNEHNQIYMSTVKEAGFNYKMTYHAYQDGKTYLGERFTVLSPDKPDVKIQENSYTSDNWDQYKNKNWYKIKNYNRKPNSIFQPNNKMVIDYE